MSFIKFLKEKALMILLVVFSLITIEIFFMIYSFGTFVKIYTVIIILTSLFTGLLYEYFRKKKYYDNIYNMMGKLEEKYLITEVIKRPGFIEGVILNDVLEEIDKSMHENVNKYKYMQEDYKEYIELWIHEIKTPIAASKIKTR